MTARLFLSLFLAVPAAAPLVAAESAPLSTLIRVGREGAGNAEAARAWKELTRQGPEVLPFLLEAMDDAGAIPSNWLRTAGDAITEKALARKQSLPVRKLEDFIAQRRHTGAARRLAYEWLCQADRASPGRLLPGMLDDPSPELRRDAVDALMKEAAGYLQRGKRDAARTTYRRAFQAACDQDQVDALVGKLDALGVKVDRAAHLGLVQEWQIVAPFDNSREQGFDRAFPPEKGLAVGETCKGKGGANARWLRHSSRDPQGFVDLNQLLGQQHSVVAYAYAIIESPKERRIQVRAGAQNAIKVFLNGKEVLRRNEYHHGVEMDQDRGSATLRAGRNLLIVKVCQNEQSEAWAQTWHFQVRLCNETGEAVPFTAVPAAAEGKEGKVKP
jgi:hypothetical protein